MNAHTNRTAALAASIEGNACPMAVVDYAGRYDADGKVGENDLARRYGTRDMRHVAIYSLKVVALNAAARQAA